MATGCGRVSDERSRVKPQPIFLASASLFTELGPQGQSPRA